MNFTFQLQLALPAWDKMWLECGVCHYLGMNTYHLLTRCFFTFTSVHNPVPLSCLLCHVLLELAPICTLAASHLFMLAHIL